MTQTWPQLLNKAISCPSFRIWIHFVWATQRSSLCAAVRLFPSTNHVNHPSLSIAMQSERLSKRDIKLLLVTNFNWWLLHAITLFHEREMFSLSRESWRWNCFNFALWCDNPTTNDSSSECHRHEEYNGKWTNTNKF